MNPQFKKGVLEMCVMAVLYERDCYGYELVNRISQSIQISEGTIYPLLKRLADDGHVSTYLTESATGAPRKYYKLNENGRARAKDSITQWKAFEVSVNGIIDPIFGDTADAEGGVN